jgi:hypothetical protein
LEELAGGPAGTSEKTERTREISREDLLKLAEWIAENPQVPDGPWCKDFGSFKLAGAGKYPKTFLLKGQPCVGTIL